MTENLRLSVVVPVYNGERMLRSLYQALMPVCEGMGSFELILVDDCSSDTSRRVIQELVDRDPRVVGVMLSRNFGQHNATLAGMKESRGEWVVTLDQDLQNPPEEIPRLVEMLETGYDVVYGLPKQRAHNRFRNLSSEFSKWISRQILSTGLKGNFSSYRVMRRWVVQEVVHYRSRYLFLDGLISWTTANVGGLEVLNAPPIYGSQYNLFRLIQHGVNLLVNFSIRPLQFATFAGFCFAFMGLLGAFWIIAARLIYGTAAQGWTSLIVTVLVMGGTQLMFLGLIGEYVGRILMNTNQSPPYIVREIHRGDRHDA